jgi:hypothetical protein
LRRALAVIDFEPDRERLMSMARSDVREAVEKRLEASANDAPDMRH